ncbi:hypothetical protein [Arthrobacter pigmenti]
MRVFTDDDLTRIDRTYLGPKGRKIPWTATYRQYGIGFATLALAFGAMVLFGVPINPYTLWAWFFGSIGLSLYIVRRLRADVSLWATFKAAWQEVAVPRDDPAKPTHYDMKICVPIYAAGTPPPETRRQRIAAASRRRKTANVKPKMQPLPEANQKEGAPL